MSLNEPIISRTIAKIMKYLNREKRFELSQLTLDYSNLQELPIEWQTLINLEMTKNTK
jgi:hypothetical protein